MNPKVSIIIPNYNKGEFARHSLDSLLRQTYDDWEAIVVDDCSSDISWRIVEEYAKKESRIISIRNKVNMGGNYCRNLGVARSSGEFLIFLDSDDWLVNDALEKRVDEMQKDENDKVDLLVFNMASSKDGNIGKTWNYGDRQKPLICFLRHEIPWSIMMPIWRRSAFQRFGGFDESFKRLQDVELHSRALIQGLCYKFAERNSADCVYYVDEARVNVSSQLMIENFGDAAQKYSEKMKVLIKESSMTSIEKRKCINALSETQMAVVGKIEYLARHNKIEREAAQSLCERILTTGGGGGYVKLYAFLCRRGADRIRGFNFLYRKVGRFIQSADIVFRPRS